MNIILVIYLYKTFQNKLPCIVADIELEFIAHEEIGDI